MKVSTSISLGLALTVVPVLANPSQTVQDSDAALAERSLAGDIWNDIKNATECAGCEVNFFELKIR
jgi:hypothetical protein